MEVKKTGTGVKVLVGLLAILLLAAIGYIVADKFILNKTEEGTTNNVVNKEEGTVAKEENKTNNSSSTNTTTSTSLKEGYVIFDDHDNKDYKIYAIATYVGFDYAVIGYKNNIYKVDGDFMCIKKINSVTFDSSNSFEGKFNEGATGEYHCKIKKFNGKEENLSKVTSSIWYDSTDGSKYPILIYKDGSIESTNESLTKSLKDYKIKDFISEECVKRNEGAGLQECSQVQYKVVLLDGTTKTITK